MRRKKYGWGSAPVSAAVLFMAILLLSIPASAGEVRLAWDPSPSTDVAGYRIHYGKASRNYTASVDAGLATTLTVSGLRNGATYYFAGTAYDRTGAGSVYSNEVSVTVSSAYESISLPMIPAGPTRGLAGTAYTYITGGSETSLDHQVQYGFSWGDGTLSGWLPPEVVEADKSWAVPGTYDVSAGARCAEDTSLQAGPTAGLEVQVKTSAVFPETVSVPSAPAGPVQALTGTAATFTVTGSASSEGHNVQYRIFWGDGSATDWLPVGTGKAQKVWGVPGSYTVRAVSRCAVHGSILSPLSAVASVFVQSSGAATESVSDPAVPSGPSAVAAGQAGSFSAGGSVSSNGHALEYRFDWGDGSMTAWQSAGDLPAAKRWRLGGIYLVRTQARCGRDGHVRSGWSAPLSVAVMAQEDEIGVYRNGSWFWDTDNNGILEEEHDLKMSDVFAGKHHEPVVADLDGDGIKETGVFYDGEWRMDMNGDGMWEEDVDLRIGGPGKPHWKPVAGDIDGDGIDEIGAYVNGDWFFDLDGDSKWSGRTDLLIRKFGKPGVIPVMGDVDGDGTDEIGGYLDGTWYFDLDGDGKWSKKSDLALRGFGGQPGMVPVVGDVDGDGMDEIGVYQDGRWYFDMNLSGAWEKKSDLALGKFGGDPDDRPVIGNVR